MMPWRTQPVRLLLIGAVVVLVATAGAFGVPESRHAEAVVSPASRIRRDPADVLSRPDRVLHAGGEAWQQSLALAMDGREETSWVGGDVGPWAWRVDFRNPVHLGLLRAVFGDGPTRGVPSDFRWEVVRASDATHVCPSPDEDDPFVTVPGTAERAPPKTNALPTRRDWYVDEDACSLRISIATTNGGPPRLREVEAIEGARDVLIGAEVTGDNDPRFDPKGAVDGRYAGRWVGAGDRHEWTLGIALPTPMAIDRIRLVLGFDAVGRPREPSGVGRAYGVSYAPLHYRLEGTEDGESYFLIGSEPLREDHSPLWVRRRLVRLGRPRMLQAIRLVMDGATGPDGAPSDHAVPVVREVAAYRADDPRHVIAHPWVMSVNANPAGVSHGFGGGELANDVYFAKFLQMRFSSFVPGMRADDRYFRALGSKGELLPAAPGENDGDYLESIEGDDPALDAALLGESNPPPLAVLSGSNDWDYSPETGPDPRNPRQWHWDPLKDVLGGGMKQIEPVLRARSVPLLGICGGAQIMALLEAREQLPHDDGRIIDGVLRRTTGDLIRGFAPPSADEVSWPGDPRGNAEISFRHEDRLFWDIAGASGRDHTKSMPLHHVDVIRPDAFMKDGPLHAFDVIATSTFCSPDVVSASENDIAFPNPDGAGQCAIVPQAFRATGAGYPAVGVQFHPEQRKFSAPVKGDPPEATEDPTLFVAALYDEVIDELLRRSP